MRADNAAGTTMSDRNTAEIGARPIIFRLADGAAVRVRPIRPEDAGDLQDYLRRLSAEARRNRFLGAVSELSPRELDRIARMDRPRELACTEGMMHIAVGPTHIVCDGVLSHQIAAAPLTGDAARVLGPFEGVGAYAIDATDAYWTNYAKPTEIMRS